MTEKRFTIHDVDCDGLFVKDNREDDIITNDDVVDKLNEQDTIVKQQHQLWRKTEKDLIELQLAYRQLEEEIVKLEIENEQLKKGIEIDNEVVKIIKKHLPIGFVKGLVDKQIENTVKSIVKELREEEDFLNEYGGSNDRK